MIFMGELGICKKHLFEAKRLFEAKSKKSKKFQKWILEVFFAH